MANTFANYTVSCTDATETTLYTVPGSTTSVIIGLTIANTTSTQIEISVKVASKYLIKDAPIPTGSSLSVLDGKIIVTAAQTVTITSSDASGNADAILSVLEIT